MGQQQPDIFSDPHAGTPLRGDVRRVMEAQAEDDPIFSDPTAGEPLRVNASKVDGAVYRAGRGVVNTLKAIPEGIYGMVMDQSQRPGRALDAVKRGEYGEAAHEGVHAFLLPFVGPMVEGLVREHLRLGGEAQDAVAQGDYTTAAIKGAEALVPGIGPMVDPSVEKIREGNIAEGGAELLTNAALMAGPAALKAAKVRIPGVVRQTSNPAEAAAIEFARREGIPLDLGTVTGSPFVKSAQKKISSSLGGASTAERMQAAQAEALEATAQRLASRANNGGPSVGAVEAGEGIRTALDARVKDFHGQANRAYGRLRDLEAASPEELVQARPAKPKAGPHVTPEQSFMLRWIESDLTEFQYQPSARMRGVHSADEWQGRGYGDVDTRYAPRVAGTPVQQMMEAAGIKGSRAEIAQRIERHLNGQKKDPRLTALADVMREAWDGQNFDFDLVSDDALLAAGVRRRDLKSPIGLPNYDEAGAAAFFPDSELTIPSAPSATGGATSGAEAMRLAVNLRDAKDAMRPVLQQLQKEREITGVLHGDKGKAAVALEGLIDGPDFAPLSTVDAALGPIKKFATSDMPQLRSRGQGLLARLVAELDSAVKSRAQAAGGDVAQSLAEGRAATRQKYQTAAAMKLLGVKGEPRAVFSKLTANRDAGLQKLRALQQQAPDQVPPVARALLDGIFDHQTSQGGFKFADKAWSDWHKVGSGTRAILFPDRSHRAALDQFFLLAKRVQENVNPSGTGAVLNPHGLTFSGMGMALPTWIVSKLLYTDAGARALTGAMQVNLRPAARAAAVARLSRAAQEAGVVLPFPAKAAEAQQDQQREE